MDCSNLPYKFTKTGKKDNFENNIYEYRGAIVTNHCRDNCYGDWRAILKTADGEFHTFEANQRQRLGWRISRFLDAGQVAVHHPDHWYNFKIK